MTLVVTTLIMILLSEVATVKSSVAKLVALLHVAADNSHTAMYSIGQSTDNTLLDELTT